MSSHHQNINQDSQFHHPQSDHNSNVFAQAQRSFGENSVDHSGHKMAVGRDMPHILNERDSIPVQNIWGYNSLVYASQQPVNLGVPMGNSIIYHYGGRLPRTWPESTSQSNGKMGNQASPDSFSKKIQDITRVVIPIFDGSIQIHTTNRPSQSVEKLWLTPSIGKSGVHSMTDESRVISEVKPLQLIVKINISGAREERK
ncbi:hypothetical protein O181_017238 [Austropuccinia psidii MF-1]|uniref:Uncharacterized protein n=1 Tax=Austropuccinia psidii MF-1 TaxID=1389203 RepID=A0A9Q3C6R4_9BASI|nr:hypothetical protein [Austropuccinia psidii MF-1]